MSDHISIVPIGPSIEKFHYFLDGKVLKNTTAAMNYCIGSGFTEDEAEDYLATLPEKMFTDIDAFNAESALAQ
jgi:hypothetical protein